MHKIAKSCGNFVVESKKCSIFAPQKEKSSTQSGCSAVRLAHLLWEQGVPSSNLGTPTERLEQSSLFCIQPKFVPRYGEWNEQTPRRYAIMVAIAPSENTPKKLGTHGPC